MTDNATLAERLRVGLMAVSAFVRGNDDAKERVYDAIAAVEEAATRIAELEAELDTAKKGRQFVLETMQAENDQLRTRIIEFEAEKT